MVFQVVMESLSLIAEDPGVPKNIRLKVKDARVLLEKSDGAAMVVAVDQVMHQIEDLAVDPSVSVYTRQQLWGLISDLERLNQQPQPPVQGTAKSGHKFP